MFCLYHATFVFWRQSKEKFCGKCNGLLQECKEIPKFQNILFRLSCFLICANLCAVFHFTARLDPDPDSESDADVPEVAPPGPPPNSNPSSSAAHPRPPRPPPPPRPDRQERQPIAGPSARRGPPPRRPATPPPPPPPPAAPHRRRVRPTAEKARARAFLASEIERGRRLKAEGARNNPALEDKENGGI